MSEQYLRRAEVHVTNKTGLKKIYADLRVMFEVNKTESSTANSGKISIYNLSQISRSFVEEEELIVELFAGYRGRDDTNGTLELLFTGNIGLRGDGKVTSVRQGSEWVTTFECGDGETELNNSHTELSFGTGVPFTAIVTQLIRSLGLAIGSVVPVGESIAINGFTASGKTKDILDKLAKRFNFNWSVQNNAVQITREKIPTPEIAVILTPNNGLIGNVTKRENGIDFRALLNPQITPGRAISIVGSSEVLAGTFKTTKTKFFGDTHGADWFVAGEAVPII